MQEQLFEELMKALGYTFRDPALLRRALTHPSVGKEDNQRLEFLGDAGLQYIMSDLLYASHPADREGALTHTRALLVCEAALSQVAARLGIGEALIMDRGEELTGGRVKPSVLCDAMEAVLAAVYLDGGVMSIPSIIGFISLFGIATRNGMLLIDRYNALVMQGMSPESAVLQGSLDRLNPILMTAVTSALALLPLALGGDLPGNEIQSPMAKVILGGLVSSTLLNGFVIPIMYIITSKKK